MQGPEGATRAHHIRNALLGVIDDDEPVSKLRAVQRKASLVPPARLRDLNAQAVLLQRSAMQHAKSISQGDCMQPCQHGMRTNA